MNCTPKAEIEDRVILIVGQRGAGKTHLARRIAELYRCVDIVDDLPSYSVEDTAEKVHTALQHAGTRIFVATSAPDLPLGLIRSADAVISFRQPNPKHAMWLGAQWFGRNGAWSDRDVVDRLAALAYNEWVGMAVSGEEFRLVGDVLYEVGGTPRGCKK